MEQSELENLVAELETRVDRLRALYDQYFMGIEKLEPQVPRKDVDRRLHTLRKEQIRNTGLRFRFQMIIQRYNTYQTYWARILRQIESGTYKRHVLRAEARFGDVLSAAAPKSRRASTVPPALADADAEPLPSQDIDDLFGDFEQAMAKPRPTDERKVAGSLDADFGMLDDPLTRLPSSMSIPAVTAEQIEAAMKAAAQAPPPAPPSGPKLGGAARPVWRKAGPAAPAAPAAPGQPPPVPPRPPAPAPAPAPAATAAAPSQPKTAPRPAITPGPRTSEPSVRAAAPAVPRPAPTPTGTGPKPPPKPAAPPAPVAKAPAAQPTAAKPPAAKPPAGEIPDERVRQLYAQYVEQKRKRNESTAAITYDGLAKSLRESSAKLREKHGRPVDFEVSEKDGKTIIRPVVK